MNQVFFLTSKIQRVCIGYRCTFYDVLGIPRYHTWGLTRCAVHRAERAWRRNYYHR